MCSAVQRLQFSQMLLECFLILLVKHNGQAFRLHVNSSSHCESINDNVRFMIRSRYVHSVTPCL
jgi:hypothetical protein